MLARLLLARHEQWLDEIISLNLASSVEGPLGIFTALHLDNNHYLNTLWLYAAGPGGSPFLYRLLSLLAGSGAVILLYAAMPRRTAFGRVAAATVFSLSAFMITLTADARGYAPMLFFGILSWMCLRRFLRTGRMTDGLAFTACAMAALLSHLIYIEWYLLLLLWSAKELGGRHKWNTLFLLHLPVLLLQPQWVVPQGASVDWNLRVEGGTVRGFDALVVFHGSTFTERGPQAGRWPWPSLSGT